MIRYVDGDDYDYMYIGHYGDNINGNCTESDDDDSDVESLITDNINGNSGFLYNAHGCPDK